MNNILIGDSLTWLRRLPDNSIHCCVSSPPYYGLRSYIGDDHPAKQHEIGLEPTPEAYIENMVSVFREVRRVLRDDGTCWLNLGTTYCNKTMQSDEMVLRDDLSEDEIAYVLTELANHASKK